MTVDAEQNCALWRRRNVKFLLLLVAAGVLCLTARAQTNSARELDFGKMLAAAQNWAEENLDENVLAALGSLDQQKVEQFLAQLQKQFGGDSVVDVAALKDAAKAVMPLLEAHEETQPYAAWLKTRLDYMEAAEPLPKGAEALVPKLKQVFASKRVPTELVWLAEVESSFDQRARSPVGAAGLFQLMPATAKRFGLRRWPFDQRYQVEPSAQAAAQYLRVLHGQFRDWPLALAAYNAGEGNVSKLLAMHKARSFDAIAPHLPAETQMYVPRVEATILRREGTRLGKLAAPAPVPRQVKG